ncbi:hypothetical protein [Leptospira interrogans]|nr:hypothetical protein [Leptospira interrogans]
MIQKVLVAIEIFDILFIGLAVTIFFFGYIWLIFESFRIHWGWGLLSLFLGFGLIFGIIIYWKKLKKPFLILFSLIPLLVINISITQLVYYLYSEKEPIKVAFDTLSKGEYPDRFYISLGPHKKEYSKAFYFHAENDTEIPEHTKVYYPIVSQHESSEQGMLNRIQLIEVSKYKDISNGNSYIYSERTSGLASKNGEMLDKETKNYIKANYPEINIKNLLVLERNATPENIYYILASFTVSILILAVIIKISIPIFLKKQGNV